MKEFIITHDVVDSYFIVNNGTFSLSYLYDLVIKTNVEMAAKLKELSTTNEFLNKPIFIYKNSDLGIILGKLIEDKKIIDMSEVIEPRHLINVLVSQSIINPLTSEFITIDNSIIDVVIDMIRDNKVGTIEELEKFYPRELLKKINRIARLTWFINDSSVRKYLKEIYLTGYELEGITYYDSDWIKMIPFVNENIQIENLKKKLLEK